MLLLKEVFTKNEGGYRLTSKNSMVIATNPGGGNVMCVCLYQKSVC